MSPGEDLILFIIGFVFLLAGIFFHILNKEKYAIVFLLFSSLLFFLFSSFLYPFLNVWDERFHALVAKNLMQHPLMPTLYDEPVVNMVYNDDWARYHIWLHKPPLFMWQIALSFKLFGVSEFTLRLPSVLLSTLMVFAGYRSGKILGNKNIGYYTAILMATSTYLMKLISGRIELDQNDISFIVYISLSFWTWLEYIKTKKIYWLFLTGAFSGFAVLCKWLVGLLIYLPMGLYSLLENKFLIKKHLYIFLSLSITALICIPWQILSFHWYPQEAKAAFELNAKHFTEAVDGHEGPFLYHFYLISKIYGSLVPYLIIPAFVLFYLKTSYKHISLALISSVLFVYLFFSFAVTKMPSFTAVVMLPVFFSLAFLADFLITGFQRLILPFQVKKIILTIGIVVFIFVRTDIYSLISKRYFSDTENETYYRFALSHNKNIFQKLQLPANTVLFNVRGRHYIEAMFYTGLPAYNFIPSEEQYLSIKEKKRTTAMFIPEDGIIPDYFKKDSLFILLKDTIRPCE
jgi:4-amino-4-deoxy-L-arabinose transferase